MRKDWGTTNPDFVNNIVAHELGHKVGRGARFLWTDPVTNQVKNFKSLSHAGLDGEVCGNCLMGTTLQLGSVRKRLTRDDWNAINFVGGSPVKIDTQQPHIP